jgi:thiol-disulfide isomerase/thioredoxin
MKIEKRKMKHVLLVSLILFFSAFLSVSGQVTGSEVGNKAPEIRLATPAGDTVALSSLNGKMVLIDFWATWCAPCVKEQPELAQLHNKYKTAAFIQGKGFEIYGVSMDSKKATWEGAISKYGITWIQVSDLKFWSSPVAKVYDLQELPYNLLIDGKGIILAKNLHGEELDQELAKYLISK